MALKKGNPAITLQLEITVDYKPNGVSKEALADLLAAIGDKAAGEGLMTGETPAEVEGWLVQVRDLATGELV